MALTTYAELKTAVARWAGGSDSHTATTLNLTNTIDDIVTTAEARIFREARTIDNEYTLNTTGAVPVDYVALKSAYISGYAPLERRPAEWIRMKYPTGSGLPKYIAREASNFIFGPSPDSSYTILGVYYRRLTALSTQVHSLFTNNPDLYLYASLAQTAILLARTDQIQIWEGLYLRTLAEVNGVDRSEVGSGSGMQMRVA